MESWTRTGEALVKFVNPALAILVKRRMQEYQQHVDEQGWEASTSDQRYVDHATSSHTGKNGPSWMNFLRCTTPTPDELQSVSGMRAHKCGQGGADVPCYFHSQPLWVRTASLFMPYNERGMLHEDTSKWPWESTALLNCIGLCSVFTDEEKQLAKDIRDKIRNKWGHQDLDMDYESAYELMEHAVGVFGGDVQGLKKHKEEAQYSFPARNSADAFEKARAKTKKLTLDQWNGLCTIWPQKDKNRRWLIDAPSGSGKTFVAVRLVCEFVRYPGRFGLTGGVLLCSHSKRLQKKTVEEVQEYMKEVGHEVAVEEVAAHFSTVTSTSTGVVLVVATIDALLVMSRSEGTDVERGGGSSSTGSGDKDVGALRFGVAVVDEGQHVFSRQPAAHLEGQHTVAAAEVRVELQRWMVKGAVCVRVPRSEPDVHGGGGLSRGAHTAGSVSPDRT